MAPPNRVIRREDSYQDQLDELRRRLDSLETAPGLGYSSIKQGRLTVNDGTFDRVELGNLAAKGNSAAQYGIRVSDATNSPIFDSLGLLKAVANVGSASSIAGGNIVGVTGPPLGVSGIGGELIVISKTFTLTRQTSVLIFGLTAGFIQTTAGVNATSGWFYIRVTGQANTNGLGMLQAGNATGTPANAFTYQVLSLAAGTYTANLYWNSINGTRDTYFWSSYALDIFQLGS